MKTKQFVMVAGVAAISNNVFAAEPISDEFVDIKADFAHAHALIQDAGDGLSLSLNQVIEQFKYDFAFLRSFYNDPEGTLSAYDLTDRERAALLTSDVNDLIGLGITKDQAIIIASGTHRGRRQA